VPVIKSGQIAGNCACFPISGAEGSRHSPDFRHEAPELTSLPVTRRSLCNRISQEADGMAEVFVTFTEPIAGPDGETYLGRVCGREMEDGRWQGWIEFERADGSETLRSPRETTQPDRTDLAYWATGLTPVYLEGALDRTLRPGPVVPPAAAPVTPAFDGPRPTDAAAPRSDAVLNPFSVYRKGETVLRQQLAALAAWHLVNIVRAYELSGEAVATLNAMTEEELIELIVAAVRHSTSVSR
jgi:hypothetical protein